MISEYTCDQCAAVETGPGCPVCDAMSHAHIIVVAGGKAMVMAWREDDWDSPGTPTVEGMAGNVSDAITLAIHHECPVMFITIPAPEGVTA